MTTTPSDLSPTLARLSFWVPAERMTEFAGMYEAQLAPILAKHGLLPSAEQGRPTPAGVFSRLFEVERPAAVASKKEALAADSTWKEALGHLASAFKGDSKTLDWDLVIYSAPVSRGKVVAAGSGKQQLAGRGRGHWRTFDATDGLGEVTVSSIFQDREGCLWFGTQGGASRYDGQNWSRFTTRDGLLGDYVGPIYQDRDGYLWFGYQLHGGASRFDGKKFSHFSAKDGLVGDRVCAIYQDREGYLWFSTWGNGVIRYDGSQFRAFTTSDGLADNFVVPILQDREGCLWFGTGAGASRFDGGVFTTFTDKEGLAGNLIQAMFQDRDGYLWFSAWEAGVSRYDGKAFKTFTTQDGVGSNEVTAITQDRQGNLWFSFNRNDWAGGGASRYDGNEFTTFTIHDGLAGNAISALLQDQEGQLWFGTMGGGVSRYDEETFTTFTTRDGLPTDHLGRVLQDQHGHYWFCSWGEGVCRCDGKHFTTFTTQDGLAGNHVRSALVDRQGNLWFTSENGVSRYDGQRFEVFTAADGLASKAIWAILEDREGVIWFGSPLATGVSCFDGKGFRVFTTADGLASSWVRSIYQDRTGYLWFGTIESGVSRYDGREFQTFTTCDGLAHNQVRAIFEDQQGFMWFSTYGGGVSRYDGKQFKTFTTQDGLAHNHVWPIHQDRTGTLWFGTVGGGLSRFDGQTFQTLTKEDGLAGNGILSIFEDQSGDFWIGTTTGVTRFRPPPPSSPKVSVDAVVTDQRHEAVETLETPTGIRLIAFEYHGMSLKTRPEAMVYRYRLEGFETEWRNTHSRRVEYQDLPVGDYTFQVRAVDRDLNYSEPATVQLKVIPDPRDQRIDELEQRVQERTRKLEEVNATLRVEAALEKVRAEVGMMRKAEDLSTVVQAMYKVFDELVLAINGVGINTMHEEEGVARLYAFFRGHGIAKLEEPLRIQQVQHLFTGWKRGETLHRRYTREVWKGMLDTADDYELRYIARSWLERPDLADHSEDELRNFVRENLPKKIAEPAPWIVDIPFSHGTVAMNRQDAPFTDEDVKILQRFAEVIELGYLRFLDFQQVDEAQRRLIQELEDELQTAHDLQMGLMPKSPPHIPGLDIAGQCIPANHVGGDFFQYFQQEGTLSLCLADVTGHAMEAAVPGLMFSGVLKSQVELGEPLDLLFQRLNRTLHSTLDARTFVCFAMGQYDPATGVFRLADAGCPYPYHYRAATGTVEELRVDAYPLGVRAEGVYRVLQTTLAPGDRVVFCSDGVIEATNAAGEMFGFERTGEVIRRGCQEGLSAEILLERVMQEVKQFRGEVAQGDDQTVVVLRVEG